MMIQFSTDCGRVNIVCRERVNTASETKTNTVRVFFFFVYFVNVRSEMAATSTATAAAKGMAVQTTSGNKKQKTARVHFKDLRTSSTPPKTKIFVGRLPEEAQSQDLRRLFEQYGVVTECDILNRYGFVHMKTEEMAARAIQELNNAEFMGVQISVEQSTGKKSGRGATRGGFGPMRGRGTMRGGMGRAPPYMRDGRGDYDRRPGMPPPPSMRNGYYDSYDRGYDNYYPSRGPPPPIMPSRDRDPERRSYPDMMRAPYERRSFSDVGRSPYDRPSMPGVASFERRSDYSGSRISSDIYRRRTPPPPTSYGGAGYERENMDPYGPPARRYPAPSPLDRDMSLARRF